MRKQNANTNVMKDGEYLKRALIAVALVILLFLLAGCDRQQEKRMLCAKIRYFDGSIDTVLLNGYIVKDAYVVLRTSEGRKVVAGINNVIIIEETESQYECRGDE